MLRFDKYTSKVNEKLGVAKATEFYLDVLTDFVLKKTKEYHSIYANKEEKIVERHYFKKFKKEDFDINDDLWKEFPLEIIRFNYTYNKRYDGKSMQDSKGTFRPMKVGGSCYGFASGNEKQATKFIRIGKTKTIDLLMDINVDVWKNFGDISDEFIKSKVKSVISHELNHAFENFKRKESKGMPMTYSLTIATYQNNDTLLTDTTFIVWEQFLNYLYMAEPHEVNAYSQELYTKVESCDFDYEVFKTKYVDDYHNLINMSEFKSTTFKSKLITKILSKGIDENKLNTYAHDLYDKFNSCGFDINTFENKFSSEYNDISKNSSASIILSGGFDDIDDFVKLYTKGFKLDTDDILDNLKDKFIESYKESISLYKETPRYNINRLSKLSFDEFLNYFEPIINNAGNKLIKAVGRALTHDKITESLLPSQFRDYVLEFDRTRYSELFNDMKLKYSGDKNAYRIYIPVNKKDNPIENEISEYLTKNGYEILDYIKGTCKFSGSKNPSKIGQVLTKFEKTDEIAKSLNLKFVSDNSRKSGNINDLLICISRHPYDIAGADTDKSWTNCMTMASPNAKRVLDLKTELSKLESSDKKDENKIQSLKSKIEGYEKEGANVWKLSKDVKNGSLISFLIKKEDLDIKNPIANLNIKPYINTKDKKDIILISDSVMYGQGMPEYKESLDKWLDEANGIKTSGLYKLKDGIYIDSNSAEIRFFGDSDSKTKITSILKELGIKDYQIGDDLKVNVNESVNISDIGITKIPVKFGIIYGSFNCSVNRLTSLINSPDIVNGDFNCSNNYLENLKNGPSEVKGLYDCSKNKLKNLNDIGKYIEVESSNNNIKVVSVKEDLIIKFNVFKNKINN